MAEVDVTRELALLRSIEMSCRYLITKGDVRLLSLVEDHLLRLDKLRHATSSGGSGAK
jgi:hypothetical protein